LAVVSKNDRFRVTVQIDAAGIGKAATVQEYRAKWRRVNEAKSVEVD
jgi:hypothetical protein